MSNITLYISFIILPFLVIAQEENTQNEIEDIFKTHTLSNKQLTVTRGMQPKQDFKRISITNILRKYKKNTAIIVYTFIDDTLQTLIINNNYKKYQDKYKPNANNSFYQKLTRYKNYHLIKSNFSKSQIVKDIDKLNSFFASQHSNKIFSDRGSVPTNVKHEEKQFNTVFSRINEALLPKELKLDDIEHLIIVPTSNIGTLPFAALKINDDYLIDLMSYSIAPSLNSIKNDSKPQKNGFKKALFISNPIFPKDRKWSFSQLPGTEEEVNKITSNLEASSYTILKGSNATKDNVVEKIEDYELLYFATHGYSDPKNSLDKSFIALSGETSKDAFLTPREIQHKKLSAKLVVLSACQTGLGVSHEGGVIGLSRAFQLGGADHVLMSLWSVNDKETAIIMTMFFNNYLKNGTFISPHEALRKAIIKYKKEINSDPKYWASFSVFGTPYTSIEQSINVNVFLDKSLNESDINYFRSFLNENKLVKIVSKKDSINADLKVFKFDDRRFIVQPVKIGQTDLGKTIALDRIEVTKAIYTFAQGEFLRKLNIKNKNYEFDFKLLPIEYDNINDSIIEILSETKLINKNGVFEVNSDIDKVILQVTNRGTEPLYFKILEIDFKGDIYPFFPNEGCNLNDEELRIIPGQTRVFKDCVFSFFPPYEKYTLKGFSSETPIGSSDYKKRNNFDLNTYNAFGIQTNMEIEDPKIYTYELEYKINE